MEFSDFSIGEIQNLCKTEILQNRKMHEHDFYSIFWIQKGEAIHATKFIEYTVNECNIFFIPAGLAHKMIISDNCQGIVIQFARSFLEITLSCSSGILQSTLFNNPDFYTIISINSEQETLFKTFTFHLKQEVQNQKLEREKILGLWLSLFLHEAKRIHTEQYTEAFQTKEENINHTIIKFKELIETSFIQSKEVSFYAEKLGLSTSCLNETSRKITGITAGEIIRNRVIDEAKKLIYSSDLNSKQIAYQLGFEDPAYFSRFFKKYTGSTILEYRDTTRKKYNKNLF